MPREICKTIKEHRELMKGLLSQGESWRLGLKNSINGTFEREFGGGGGAYLFKTSNGSFQIPLREIYYHKKNHLRAHIINPENEIINEYFFKN